MCESFLCIPRRRLGGAEHGLRPSKGICNRHCGRVRATEHAPGFPFRVLEGPHGLAEFFERGGGVLTERPRVNPLPSVFTRVFGRKRGNGCFSRGEAGASGGDCGSDGVPVPLRHGIR